MAAVQDIFDPVHYAKVRLPYLEAETLPTWCYTSQEFYDREIDRIFKRCWNFVGRVDEIADPGDYRVIDLFGESLILIRDKSGEVGAFANTCRHRGTRLLTGEGSCRVITCPYHGWAYSLSGDLVATPGMEKTVGFERNDYGLVPVRLETWAGFMFVNLDAAAESLADYLGDLPEQFASYNFDDMVCVRRKTYDLACNWKIFLENAMEDYHTPVVHKASIGKQVTTRVVTTGAWDAIHMEADRTCAILPEETTTFPHIATLSGPPARGTHFTAVYPCTFLGATHDCMWWLHEVPQGPARTRLEVGSCFPRETAARPDFETEVEKYYRRWDESVPEDGAISEEQQAGIESAFSVPGRLSWHEPVVHAIANWVLDRTIDD